MTKAFEEYLRQIGLGLRVLRKTVMCQFLVEEKRAMAYGL